MGGRRRCCCLRDCVIFEDDYNRATGTNLGKGVGNSDYTEVSDDWEIAAGGASDNCLQSGGAANALVRVEHDATKVEMIIYVSTNWNSGRPRIIVNWDDTTNSYYFVEIENLGGSEVDWHFYRAPGGVPELIKTVRRTFNASGWVDLEIQFGFLDPPAPEDDRVTFSIGPMGSCQTYGAWVCVTPFSNGTKMGFGSGTAAVVKFDDLTFENGYGFVSKGVQDFCGGCDCDCDGHCVSTSLIAVWECVGGNPGCNDPECEEKDGLEVPLEQTNEAGPNAEVQECGWWQDADNVTTFCSDPSWTPRLMLYKRSDKTGVSAFELADELGAWFGADVRTPATGSTCYPLNLIYEDIEFRYDPYGCCEWKVTVTEAP